VKNYYKILGVSRETSHREIQHMYRRKSQLNHPDRGGCGRVMAEINEAWAVLGDSQKRQHYTTMLAIELGKQSRAIKMYSEIANIK